MGSLLIGLGSVLAVVAAIIIGIYLVATLMGFVFGLIGHVFRVGGAMIADSCRVVGSSVVVACLVPMTVGSIVFGRWSASSHFGRAIQHELASMGKSLYRVVIGHPVRLFGAGSLTEGIEQRLPEIVAQTPGADKPSRRTGAFDGYTITASLPGGGSGSKLYVATPNEIKKATFLRQGIGDIDKVVIKSFSQKDGSSLPQIMREGRALDAAKRLGLVLEHDMTEERFHYVMRYVPGESLGVVGQRLHSLSGGKGLGDDELRECMGYALDLLSTLRVYHSGGLWHKDVKPDNVIVDGTSAHLVDFGLVTPLSSAMTLTTHGTEYFRDPELVRMALKGVKVSEVDGTRFDIYGIGAVLYQLIENSFPAHGGLSQISQRCPEALKWVIRRAMTDYDKRYTNVDLMYADIEALRTAENLFKLKLVDLPSVKNADGDPPIADIAAAQHRAAPLDVPAAMVDAADASAAAQRGSPIRPHQPVEVDANPSKNRSTVKRAKDRIHVTNWWRGSIEVDGESQPNGIRLKGARLVGPSGKARPHTYGHPLGLSAADQLRSARQRVADTRKRAHKRRSDRQQDRRGGLMVDTMRDAREKYAQQRSYSRDSSKVGIAIALFLFLGACLVFVAGIFALAAPFGPSRASDGMIEYTTSISFSGTNEARITLGVPEQTGQVFTVNSAPDVPMFPQFGPFFEEAAGTLLVTWDDRASWSVGVMGVIDTALDKIDVLGYDIVGRGTDEKTTAVLGQLRHTIGTSTWGSTAAREALNDWFAMHDEFDAIIWFDRGDGSSDAPRVWTVANDGIDEDAFEHLVIEAFGSE